PTGWVFPGDPGVPSTLAPTRWNNFAPRLGVAYSFGDYDGMLGKILGKSGTTSIRAGWGIFYSTFEGATDFNEIGDAPFGNFTGQSQPTFDAPFTNRSAGSSITNFFPVTQPPLHFSANHPASGPPFDNLPDFFSPFGNDSYFITAGSSSYNSLQVSYKHTSGRLQTLIGYTLSKSFDDSSGYGEQINPTNHRLSRGLSAFDSTNNFVASYNYTLPIDKLGGPTRLTHGWAVSGITKFATGLPVTLVETD